MTSVYGDLILQDGAKVINKSGNVLLGSPTRIFGVTFGASTSATGTAIATTETAVYNNALITIGGIPSDLISNKIILGSGIILNTLPGGKSMASYRLTEFKNFSIFCYL
ncbi:hypothetical protein ACTFIR_012821 [Dictyostelium discoideum]